MVVEDEPEIDESSVCLDWFNSDLSLRISKEGFMVAEPFFKDGWGYVWSGARATYGYEAGKVCFEVKLVEEMESKLEGVKNLHELRLGWTLDEDSYLVGENKARKPGGNVCRKTLTSMISLFQISFCYSGSGKKGKDCVFEDYGTSFAKGDVVTAYADLDSEPAVFSFAKNGEAQGTAFEIPKADLEGKAIFPTINTRYVRFQSPPDSFALTRIQILGT